jgi:hypothetical protein
MEIKDKKNRSANLQLKSVVYKYRVLAFSGALVVLRMGVLDDVV